MNSNDLKINELYIFNNDYNIGIFQCIEPNKFLLIKDINFSYQHASTNQIYTARTEDYQYLKELTKLDKVKYL